MKITRESHIGICLQNLYSTDPATEQALVRRTFTASGGVAQADLDSVATLLELVQLSPADEVRLLNAPKKTYILTKRAREVVHAIALSKLLPVSRLLPLLQHPRCICMSPTSAYFLWADQGTVKAYIIEGGRSQTGEFLLGTMSCDLHKVYELLDVFSDSSAEIERTTAGLVRGSITELIQMLIFLELTDPQILLVPAGKKHSERPLGYANDARRNVFIVDSTWNKFIVRVEGFGVRGHFRLQPCGVGLSELKLIWIAAFEKNGYVRRPRSGAGLPT